MIARRSHFLLHIENKICSYKWDSDEGKGLYNKLW